MDIWPYAVQTMTRTEIDKAIDDDIWQTFRLSLKGTSTWHKLEELENYLFVERTRVRKIRVDNYINALLRGGQLVHHNGQIVIQR